MVLCLSAASQGTKCWVSDTQNQTDVSGTMFNREAPGIAFERECPTNKPNCLGIAYQVVKQWMYMQGCTNEAVMDLTETKKGRGGYWKIVCNTDYCNGTKVREKKERKKKYFSVL